MAVSKPAPADAKVVAKSKHAVVFIPAIGPWTPRKTETVAMCLTQAIDHNARTRGKKFVQKAAPQTLSYGNEQRARVHTIALEDDEKLRPLIDLYEFDYGSVFPSRFERFNLILKSVFVALTVGLGLGRSITAITRKAVSPIDKMHMVIAILVLAGLAIYTFTLMVAVAQFATPRIVITWPQNIALALTGLGLLTPSVKKTLERAAIDYVSSINYLTMGGSRGDLVGQLSSLLERVGEQADYERIDVFAYSFGSIIAIDALFPPGRTAPPALESIHTFVTIGSPFDMVRAFWPSYFKTRLALSRSPRQWINVWSTADVLSSNFRDGQTDDATVIAVARRSSGRNELVTPENLAYEEGPLGEKLGFMSLVFMTGFRTHGMYWSESDLGWDAGCFGPVVTRVWGKEPFLA